MCVYIPLAQPWVRGFWDSRWVSATHNASFCSADSGTEFVISRKGSSSQLIWALRSGLVSLMGRSSRSRTASFNTENLSVHHSYKLLVLEGVHLQPHYSKAYSVEMWHVWCFCTHQGSMSDGWIRWRREIKQEIVSSGSMRSRHSWWTINFKNTQLVVMQKKEQHIFAGKTFPQVSWYSPKKMFYERIRQKLLKSIKH